MRRIAIAILLAITVAGCTRSQTSGLRLPPLAATWVRGPAAPQAPLCSWLGVVVDNAIPARPQWGIAEADIVYEVPTEAMITRFLALYCGDGPDTVGPVRSLRLQFLDIAGDYGATIAHSGSSASALAAIDRRAGPVINEFWNARPFRRDPRRRMPHNVFVSVGLLRQYMMETVPSTPRLWTTADLAPVAAPVTITIPYGRGYTSQFVFDPGSGRYRRVTHGGPAGGGPPPPPGGGAPGGVPFCPWGGGGGGPSPPPRGGPPHRREGARSSPPRPVEG